VSNSAPHNEFSYEQVTDRGTRYALGWCAACVKASFGEAVGGAGHYACACACHHGQAPEVTVR
jgi:hypothetical protein